MRFRLIEGGEEVAFVVDAEYSRLTLTRRPDGTLYAEDQDGQPVDVDEVLDGFGFAGDMIRRGEL